MNARATGQRSWTLLLGALLAAGCAAAPKGAPPSDGFVIQGARIFDGERFLPPANVVVSDGHIVRVDNRPAPDGMRTISAEGMTLTPCLFDAHVHPTPRGGLAQALAFGVCTVIGMTADPALGQARSSSQEADIKGAGWAVTAPGGLGSDTEGAPVLAPGASAAEFVRARVKEGSSHIELMYDHGSAWGVEVPSISKKQLSEAVKTAHELSRLTLIDIATHAEVEDALAAKIDGFAHLYVEGPNPALVERIAKTGAFVTATLPVLFSGCDGRRGPALAQQDWVRRELGASALRLLQQSYHPVNPGVDCRALLASTIELHRAGVPLLAGSDAPFPGTAYGATLHDGIAMLVEAGLSPAEALRAATSLPAKIYGFSDRGRIAPGMRADLLLVEGDPSQGVQALRRIREVFKGGVRFERARYRAQLPRRAPLPRLSDLDLGSFEGSAQGWTPTGDRVEGGAPLRSSIQLQVQPQGAMDSEGALLLKGRVQSRPKAWAGALRFLADTPTDPVLLDPASELRLWIKGDDRRYQAWLYVLGNVERAILLGEFHATKTWAEVVMPLSAVPPQTEAVALAIVSDRPGDFRVWVDEVELAPATSSSLTDSSAR